MVFLYINEKSKLNIAKYNKNIQKNIDISIINYKLFTGKYIIYESKGFGKEYNSQDNSLIYEGEYLNGERNGKGKEYDSDGNLKFEGEYLNGKRNGKGKEYDFDGNLKFEGEYFYGKKWNGNGYDESNNIIYELKNGKGYVKEYNEDGVTI